MFELNECEVLDEVFLSIFFYLYMPSQCVPLWLVTFVIGSRQVSRQRDMQVLGSLM